MQWFITHICPERVWISVQVKLFHVTYSPIPLQRGLIAVPHPGLLMVVDGDTGQFLQDRDHVKALAGTTQLLLWLSTPLPCSAMRFLLGGWEQGPACFCCSSRDAGH